MKFPLEAYLDIETTGLSPFYNYITVIGIFICNDRCTKFVQLVGNNITKENLLRTLKEVNIIYTYNGSKFDLPFIEASLEINLTRYFRHHDLMLDCWQMNLYGGFKAVEEKLGITRRLKDVDGKEAVKLWWQYKNQHDQNALNILLEYNKEDVVNLKILREKLIEYHS
jgi:hypothetical protein